MEYKLNDDDYLNLWKYFQDKATSIIGAMFNTITRILGFAAVILGFMFTNLAKYEAENAKLTLEELLFTNKRKDRKTIKIWNQLLIIVGLFAGAFLLILMYAICQIIKT